MLLIDDTDTGLSILMDDAFTFMQVVIYRYRIICLFSFLIRMQTEFQLRTLNQLSCLGSELPIRLTVL